MRWTRKISSHYDEQKKAFDKRKKSEKNKKNESVENKEKQE